jgi:hypothetical protein
MPLSEQREILLNKTIEHRVSQISRKFASEMLELEEQLKRRGQYHRKLNRKHAEHMKEVAALVVREYLTAYEEEGSVPTENDFAAIRLKVTALLNGQTHSRSLEVSDFSGASSEMTSSLNEIVDDADKEIRIAVEAGQLVASKKGQHRTDSRRPATGMDFSFVADTRIRTIVERDSVELQKLGPSQASKSVLVLAGSIMEGLIFDALVTDGKYTLSKPAKNT